MSKVDIDGDGIKMPESNKPQYEIINTSNGLRAVPISRAVGRVRNPVIKMAWDAEKKKEKA